jgi:hypothetical protein
MPASTFLSKIKARKNADALTDWHEWPEWRRAQEHAESVRAQSAQAAVDHAAAEAAVADLRTAVERAEVSVLLGDAAPEVAEGARAQLQAAEQTVTEAARRVERFEAATRVLDVRLERLAQDLRRQFREQWLTAYRRELASANRATLAAASAHERLAQLWLKGGEDTATSQAPGPLLQLLKNGSVSAIAPWLAAVRVFGSSESGATE